MKKKPRVKIGYRDETFPTDKPSKNENFHKEYTEARKTGVKDEVLLSEAVLAWFNKYSAFFTGVLFLLGGVGLYFKLENDIANSKNQLEKLTKKTERNSEGVVVVEKQIISISSNLEHLVKDYDDLKKSVDELETDLKQVEIEQAKQKH